MRPVVYGTVALLIVIAALNLLTTLGLAIRERERDYAVLASVGATPRQVRATVVAGGAALAVPAALLGLPLGAWIFMLVIGAHRPGRRAGRARRSRPGGGTRSRSPARSCWRRRSARWPRAARCGSARPPRCAPSRSSTVRRVSLPEMLAVAGAGVAAGAVNAVVGSGSLITFPTLLAVGYPPVTANVSNTVGLVFGGISGALGLPARAARPGAARRHARHRHGARRARGRDPAAVAAEQRVRRGGAGADPAVGRADGVQAHAEARGGARPRAPRHRRHVPHRHLRRLLRRRAGRDPARGAAARVRRRPAAPQRGQERARLARQRGRRGAVRRGRAHRLGGRGDARRRARSSAARSARTTAGGCPSCGCAGS